jgi:hypothetical protein
VSRRQQLLIGIAAGLGCALKPTFAVALVLPEICGWLCGRSFFRTASLSGALVALVYAAGILILCPAYIEHAIPLALALYGGTDTPALALLGSAASLLIGLAVLAMIWGGIDRRGFAARRGFAETVFIVLAIFALGATISYFIAGKNWFYHRIPAIVSILLALALWTADCLPKLLRNTSPSLRRRGWACATLVVVAFACFVQGQVELMRPWIAEAVEPSLSTEVRLERIIRREHARTYLAFSEWIGLGFPVVDNTGVVWTSRFDSMWALRGELWRARHDGRDPKAWPIRQWVARDFVKGCPDIVVVDSRSGINFVGVLVASDASFAKAWTRYHEIAAFDGLRVLKRQGEDCMPGKPLPRVAEVAIPTP